MWSRDYHILRISSNLFPSNWKIKNWNRSCHSAICFIFTYNIYNTSSLSFVVSGDSHKKHYDFSHRVIHSYDDKEKKTQDFSTYLNLHIQVSSENFLIHFSFSDFNNLYDSRDIHDGRGTVGVAIIISNRSMQQRHKTEISIGQCINRFNKLHRSQWCTVSKVRYRMDDDDDDD